MNNLDLERQIKEFVEKGLSGDMGAVNAIEDRLLRGKVKAAIVKAKRAGVATPKVVKRTEEPSLEEPIAGLVKEGLAGNMDSINALEDRVLRAKVKSALIKAKKLVAASSQNQKIAQLLI